MHFRTRGDKGVELSLPSDSEWTAVNEQYITGEHFFFNDCCVKLFLYQWKDFTTADVVLNAIRFI